MSNKIVVKDRNAVSAQNLQNIVVLQSLSS